MLKVFFASLFILMIISPSQAENLLQADETGKLQASLQGVTLMEVKSFFEKNYSIKFIADDNLLQAQVSIYFENLNLEKALKRIFTNMNVVVVYNIQGEIIEVRLLPTSQNHSWPAIASTPINSEELQVPVEQIPASLTEDTVFQDDMQDNDSTAVPQGESIFSPDEDIKFEPDDIISSFQVEENSPPSGNFFQIVPSAPPSFK